MLFEVSLQNIHLWARSDLTFNADAEEEQEHMEDSEKLKRFLNEGEKITKSVLVNRVIAWSEMKSEDVMKEVKLLAEHFTTMKRLYKK
jgi:hypothetical protein